VNAVRTIHGIGRDLARHLEPYDMVLSPTMAMPPHPLGLLSLSNPDREAQGIAVLQTVGYTQMANASGHPAMSVPLYWNEHGLPIGVQFMGRMDGEGALYQLAGQLEAARPWFGRRAQLG
jgi:Asp-tRNA(Asn)/Glu-tRNA(Gln) amidotransferase A subunit family amidase